MPSGALSKLESFENAVDAGKKSSPDFGLGSQKGSFQTGKSKSKTPAKGYVHNKGYAADRRQTSSKFSHPSSSSSSQIGEKGARGAPIVPGQATAKGREMAQKEKQKKQINDIRGSRKRPDLETAKEIKKARKSESPDEIEVASDEGDFEDEGTTSRSSSKKPKRKLGDSRQSTLELSGMKQEYGLSDNEQSQEWTDGNVQSEPRSGKGRSNSKKGDGGKRGGSTDTLVKLKASKGANPGKFYGDKPNKSHDHQPFLAFARTKTKAPSKSSKPPEVLDLVSDDDDELFQSITKNDKYATVDSFDDHGEVRMAGANERREETRPQCKLLRCTRVSRIYFGRKGYGNSNCKGPSSDETRDMAVSAYEGGIRVEEEYVGDANPNFESWKALPYEKGMLIEAQKIAKVFVRAIENSKAKTYFCSVLLKGDSESTLRNVYMGPELEDATLNPRAKQGDPAKYVTIVVGGEAEAVREDHRVLEKSLQRMCSKHNVEFVRTKGADDHHYLSAAEASLVDRLKWDGEDEKKAARSQRSTKRKRRQSEPMTEIGLLDGDRDTYLVWPHGEDATNSITLTKGDKRRLGPMQYLNDSLIDFKLRYLDLEEYKQRQGQWHAYSTFFYSRLNKPISRFAEAYRTVERWTKSVDVFAKHLLVIPINEGEHWSVIFVLRPGLLAEKAEAALPGSAQSKTPKSDSSTPSSPTASQLQSQSPSQSSSSSSPAKKKKKGEKGTKQSTVEEEEARPSPVLLFMDSLSYHNAKTMCGKVRRYLQYEYLSKKRGGFIKDSAAFGMTLEDAKQKFPDVKAFCGAVESMKMVQVNKRELPTQENGYDCGMYLVKYVECMLDKWPDPTNANVDKNFKSVIFSKGKNTFTSDDIDAERSKFQSVLEALKPTYDLYTSEQEAKEHQEKVARVEARKKKLEEEEDRRTTGGGKGDQEGELKEKEAPSSTEKENHGGQGSTATSTTNSPSTVNSSDKKSEQGAKEGSQAAARHLPYPVLAFSASPPAPAPAAAAEEGVSMDVASDSGTLDGTQSDKGEDEGKGTHNEEETMDVESTQQQSV